MLKLDIEKLTENDLVAIFSKPSRDSKRFCLLKALDITNLDEEDEMRKSIVVDYCLDAICFAASQGFQWPKVLRTLKFCFQLLSKTAIEASNLEDAAVVLKQSLPVLSRQLTVTETKDVIDYLIKTLFQHYSLYMLCMTEERELDLSTCYSMLEPPCVPEPLKNGTELETWKYQQKMMKIEEEHKHLQIERIDKLQTSLKEIEKGTVEQMNNLDEVFQTPSDGSDLKDILHNLTKLHVEYLESEIQDSLEESKMNVEFAVKKKQIGKPEVAKARPSSKNRPRSKNKNNLRP